MEKDSCVIVGYSGHAYVAIDILKQNGIVLKGYCDREEKKSNPFNLSYLGPETGLKEDEYIKSLFFIGIGNNAIRSEVYSQLLRRNVKFISAIHHKAIIADSVQLDPGVLVAAGACINPLVKIGIGAICNTSCSIDHECRVGNFSHIGPGAVLCGNVVVGRSTFIGANSVIKEGVTIGDNVLIGAGSVVLKDIASGMKSYGNPCR